MISRKVGGEGVGPLAKFSERGRNRLTGSEFLEGVAGKEGVVILSGGVAVFT